MDGRVVTASIDVMDLLKLQEMEIGTVVEVLIKGKVTSVRGPEESLGMDYPSTGSKKPKEVKHKYPGNVRLEVQKVEVNPESEFAGMEDD